MSAAVSVSDDTVRLRVLDAIRALGGRFTIGDLVSRSGVPPHEVERQLGVLVTEYESDIDVDDDGNLLYRFDPGLAAREDIVVADRRRRRRQALKRGFIAFFKAWTVAMVIIYAIVLAVLAIAAVVAASSQNKGESRGRSRGGGAWIGRGTGWSTIFWGGRGWSRSRRRRRRWVRDLDRRIDKGDDPYEMNGGAAEAGADGKPGLVERTWFFLFGADSVEQTPLEREKELLTYIRAKKGLISNADIMALLGVVYDEADSIGTRLVATYGGELDLTDDGVAIYRFPDLMLSAAPEVAESAPSLGYLWQTRQKLIELKNNPSILVPGLNGLNLLLAYVTYTFTLRVFGWSNSGPAVFWLVVFPVIFSLAFFAVAGWRMFKDSRQAGAFERENLRISVYKLIFTRRKPVRIPGDERAIAAAGLGSWGEVELKRQLPAIAAGFRGTATPDGEGMVVRAERVIAEMNTVEALRKKASNMRPVGTTVFSSRDDEAPALGRGGEAVEERSAGGATAGGDALADAIEELERELKE